MEIDKTVLNKEEDRLLVESAKAGDDKAYEALMKKYHKSVYYTLLKMVYNQHDAEDLTQEAFVKAFKALPKFDFKYAFSTWLFRIATNNCIDFLRKKRIKTLSIDQNEEDEDKPTLHIKDDGLSPSEIFLKKQRKEYVKEAVEKLPMKYQILIKYRYFKEYSYAEMAEYLELPLGTIKAQLYRARELLLLELKNKKDIM